MKLCHSWTDINGLNQGETLNHLAARRNIVSAMPKYLYENFWITYIHEIPICLIFLTISVIYGGQNILSEIDFNKEL